MAGAALPLLAAGGILSASSQWQQGQNASRAATSAANQLESNARLAEQAAGQEKAVSQRKSAEALRQNRRLQSRQIALAAAGGASTSEKGIADIISDTAAEGRYASEIALYEGNLRSDALLNEAIGLRNKAAVTRYEGKQARRAGNIGAVSSLLSAGATGAMFYGKYGQKAPADTGLNSSTSSGGYSDGNYLSDLNDYSLTSDFS